MIDKQSCVKLFFGPYKTPRFDPGDIVIDQLRGAVRLVRMSRALIPWPIGVGGHPKTSSPALYKGLARAVRKESSAAIQHWFGVSENMVTRWRKSLGVKKYNAGTTLLKKANGRV